MEPIYQKILDIDLNRQPAALCTVVRARGSTPRHSSSKMLVQQDGKIAGTIGGGELEKRVIEEALQALQDGNTRLLEYQMNDPARGDAGICGGQVDVYVEPIFPVSTIVIVGGGHVGKAVAHLAKWLGYRVVISDDRSEFCTRESTPEADEYHPVPLVNLCRELTITQNTYFVLTTRGTDVDVTGLPAILNSKSKYVGVIGSRKRWAETKKQLKEKGISQEQLDRIHSPIGMGIGAETPEEIAVSILAEIIMLERCGSGKPMKELRS